MRVSREASLLARLADGGLRDALSLLDQCAGPSGPIGEQEVLDALGLAGNLETARLMEQLGGGDTAGALETLARLYGAGKDVGSLLGELSALTRDLLIRKTAPEAYGPCYQRLRRNTMRRLSNQFQTARLVQMLGLLQTTIADLSRSGNRRTDTELCLIRLCDPGLDESTAALNARLARVEELLAGGIPAACAVPGQPMKQSAPAKREPSAPRAEPVPAERPPLEEERPPLPDEPGERVDVDETPEPSAAPEDRLVAGEAPTGGEAGRSAAADLWPGLVAAVRGKFPAVYPFLSNPAMVQGRLEDGVLTLWVKDRVYQEHGGRSLHSGGAGAAGLGSDRRPGALRGQGGEGARCPGRSGTRPGGAFYLDAQLDGLPRPAAPAPPESGSAYILLVNSSFTTSSFRNTKAGLLRKVDQRKFSPHRRRRKGRLEDRVLTACVNIPNMVEHPFWKRQSSSDQRPALRRGGARRWAGARANDRAAPGRQLGPAPQLLQNGAQRPAAAGEQRATNWTIL